MNPIQEFIIQFLTQNPEGATNAEIHQAAIQANVIPDDADLAVTYYHLNNEHSGLAAAPQHLVWRNQDVYPIRYFLNNQADGEGICAAVDYDISQNGFDGLLDRLNNGVGGGIPYTIIPGQGGACTSTVVAIADSQNNPDRGCWTELDRILTNLKTHLIYCKRVRKVKVVFDAWNSNTFQIRHFDELKAFAITRGINFIFCLVGPDRHQVITLPIQF